jgi:hypothetical protein
MIPQNLITNEEKEKRERGKERIFLPLIRSWKEKKYENMEVVVTGMEIEINGT